MNLSQEEANALIAIEKYLKTTVLLFLRREQKTNMIFTIARGIKIIMPQCFAVV